jgi:hypothetical protein
MIGMNHKAATVLPNPISEEQVVYLGTWLASVVRRLLRRPGRYRFTVLLKDGQWHNEDVLAFSREDALRSLREKYENISEILDR